MTNKDISFSSYFVLVDDEKVTHKLFYLAFPLNTKFNKNINATNYSIDVSEESDFAKLYIEFGNPLPRPEKVFNLNTQTEEDNPRTVDQYEPKQEFAVFDFRTSTLWISYSKHKNFFTDTFKEAFQTENVVLKNIYNEAEVFDQNNVFSQVISWLTNDKKNNK